MPTMYYPANICIKIVQIKIAMTLCYSQIETIQHRNMQEHPYEMRIVAVSIYAYSKVLDIRWHENKYERGLLIVTEKAVFFMPMHFFKQLVRNPNNRIQKSIVEVYWLIAWLIVRKPGRTRFFFSRPSLPVTLCVNFYLYVDNVFWFGRGECAHRFVGTGSFRKHLSRYLLTGSV